MKIKNITTTTFKAPLKTPFVTSLRRVEYLEDIIVIIECDDGTIGYGEGVPTPAITGETFESMQSAINYIQKSITGIDIESFDSIIHKVHNAIAKNTTAKSAVEIALYDIKAKSLKKPLYQMLGGTQREFFTDLTISLNDIDTMVQDSLNAVSLGYKSLKIKLGSDIQTDIQRVLEIHDALQNQDISLRLDANQAWSAKDSVKLLQHIEHQNIKIEFIEQPTLAYDLDALSYIKQRVQTPLLADESIFDIYDAKRVLQMDCADIINIKLAKSGGISNALKIADMTKEYGKKCMIGCMLEGIVSINAGVALASAKADVIEFIDLDAPTLLKSYDIKTDTIYHNASITLGDSYGVGVKL
jgi:o-succinylbenzoate synthase